MDPEEYRLHFSDGTSTIIVVMEDEAPADAAVRVCDAEGWDMNTITSIEKIP